MCSGEGGCPLRPLGSDAGRAAGLRVCPQGFSSHGIMPRGIADWTCINRAGTVREGLLLRCVICLEAMQFYVFCVLHKSRRDSRVLTTRLKTSRDRKESEKIGVCKLISKLPGGNLVATSSACV